MSIKRFNGAGILSAKSNKVWDQTTTQNDFQSIATVIVPSAGQQTITFSNIPQNYTHLQIRGISQSTTTGTDSYIKLNNTISDQRPQMVGDGSSAYSAANTGTAYLILTSSSAGASIFAGSIVDIPDYTSGKIKGLRCLSGRDNNGSGLVSFGTATYSTVTGPITQIDIVSYGTAHAQYTQFALYGIKVAS